MHSACKSTRRAALEGGKFRACRAHLRAENSGLKPGSTSCRHIVSEGMVRNAILRVAMRPNLG